MVFSGFARVPSPVVSLPFGPDTYTHCSTRPSPPSQLSSVKLGSIGSALPVLLHAYSQPHVPVSGLPSMSKRPAGHPVEQLPPSPPPVPPVLPVAPVPPSSPPVPPAPPPAAPPP